MDITLLITSLLAGMLTILAPCVLPVLPVVLAGSVTEKRWWYPYMVTLSLALSIVLFTVILKATTALIDIPSVFWKSLSGGILIVLGLVYIFPHAWAWISEKCGFTKSGASLDHAQDIGSPLLRAIATGAALGPVFSTCSPTYAFLLATVFPVSLIAGIGYTLVYALGLALMLTLIAVGGRSLIARFRGIADEKGWFKRVLGVVFVLIGILIISGVDKKIETWVLDRFDVSAWEQSLFDTLRSETDEGDEAPASEKMSPKLESNGAIPGSQVITSEAIEKVSERAIAIPNLSVANPYPAQEWSGLTSWMNSEALTLESLKGKVVLVDFWTFGCINCQRTIPHVEALYQKYRDQGFVVMGVHAPEFAFERKGENVKNKVKEFGITYPVALDNDFSTWSAYENQYWPALYFIDKNGKVRHTYFGEGDYEKHDRIVEYLLSLT